MHAGLMFATGVAPKLFWPPVPQDLAMALENNEKMLHDTFGLEATLEAVAALQVIEPVVGCMACLKADSCDSKQVCCV